MTKFAVPADVVRLVSTYISDEETRYYLGGIQFEKCEDASLICVATNGHMLGACRTQEWSGSVESGVIVAVGKLEQALKSKKSDGSLKRYLVVDAGKNRAEVVIAGDAELALSAPAETVGVTAPALIDGTFPDWRRVVPNDEIDEKRCDVAVNPEYLEMICAGYRAVAGFSLRRKASTVPISTATTGKGSGPTLVNFASDAFDFFALIMPVRNGVGAKRPSWV